MNTSVYFNPLMSSFRFPGNPQCVFDHYTSFYYFVWNKNTFVSQPLKAQQSKK